MEQKWWYIAAGAVGLAVTILLLPRPDTGEGLEANVENADPLNFKENLTPEQVTAQRKAKRVSRNGRKANTPGMVDGPNPIAAQLMAQRNTPQAMTASRMSAPWTVIRRELILNTELADHDDAKAFGEGLAELVLDLRNLRREPEAHDFTALMERHRTKLDELGQHETWVDSDIVQQQITRLDEVLTAHEQGVTTPPPVPRPPGNAEAPPAQE
jgi:hypothetical protein